MEWSGRAPASLSIGVQRNRRSADVVRKEVKGDLLTEGLIEVAAGKNDDGENDTRVRPIKTAR